MSRLILPRRRLLRLAPLVGLATPALILPHRRGIAQALPGPGPGTPAAPPAAAWTLVSSVQAITGSALTITSSPISTLTANCIVVGIMFYNVGSSTAPTFNDNLNTSGAYIAPSSPFNFTGVDYSVYSLVAANPIVGASHTFTVTSTVQQYATLFAYAFKSATGTPAIDTSSGSPIGSSYGSASGVTTVTLPVPSPGPTHANDLVYSTFAEYTASNVYSINSGMQIPQQISGGALAWGITSTAISPTWTMSIATSSGVSTRMYFVASF